MRPAEFTTDQIIQSGHDLQAAGRNVTGFALRQRVGGGNPARLRQVWEEYLASTSVVKDLPIVELPVEVAEEVSTVTAALSERITKLATELNDKAVKAAERRVAEAVRATGEQSAQAERELADAAQTVDDLENALDMTKAKVTALEEKLIESQEANQARAVELAHLSERLAATEAISEKCQTELSTMTALADSERAKRDTAEDARRQVEATLASTNVELAKITQRFTDLETELARVHATDEASRKQHTDEITRLTADFSRQLATQAAVLQSVQGEADRLRGQLAEAGGKLDASSARERAKIEETATAKAEAARLADQLKDQKTRSVEVIAKLEKGKQTLDADLIASRNEIRELAAQLGKATGELDALRTQVVGQTDVIKGFAASAQGNKKAN